MTTETSEGPVGSTGSVDPANTAGDRGPVQPSEILIGAGQGFWLAVTTLIAVVALVVASVALVVASDDDGGGGGATPPPSGPATEVTVEATEFAFSPTDLEIAADTDVTVTLDNAGAVPHLWVVLESEIATEDEFDESLVVAGTEQANGGESATATVNLPAGTYQVICSIPGHFTAGMTGELTVS